MLVAKDLARYAHSCQSHHLSHTQSMVMMNVDICFYYIPTKIPLDTIYFCDTQMQSTGVLDTTLVLYHDTVLAF